MKNLVFVNIEGSMRTDEFKNALVFEGNEKIRSINIEHIYNAYLKQYGTVDINYNLLATYILLKINDEKFKYSDEVIVIIGRFDEVLIRTLINFTCKSFLVLYIHNRKITYDHILTIDNGIRTKYLQRVSVQRYYKKAIEEINDIEV